MVEDQSWMKRVDEGQIQMWAVAGQIWAEKTFAVICTWSHDAKGEGKREN